MKKLVLIFLMSMPLLSMADPECDYHFDLSNAVILIEETSQVVQKDMEIWRGQNSPSGRCGLYRVFFSKGLANSYQRRAYNISGNYLNYNLHSNINQSGILKDLGDAVTNNEFLHGEAPEKHNHYSKSFFISMPGLSTTLVRSGTYLDIVQVTIYGYNENSGNYNFEEADYFTLLFHIPKRIQISLIDEGGAFDSSSTSKVLDFGLLAQGQVRGADLRVVSNASYQVNISSQNNGKLKMNQGDTINYSLKVNGSNVPLAGSSTAPVLIGTGDLTTAAGDLFNLKFNILESTNYKSAGLYQDVLTITAIAN